MSIDYDKIEGFKSLEPKEAKAALATYAQESFSVKLNKQKSFENMLVDLVAAVPVEEEKPEIVVKVDEPEFTEPAGFDKGKLTDVNEFVAEPLTQQQEEITPVLKAHVSDSDEVSGDLVWLEGFTPTIYLLGRNAGNNGYYSCPYWIYDWIESNLDWFRVPDQCPYASAIPTIKSLAYYVIRDGSVCIRESRNSRFITLKFSL